MRGILTWALVFLVWLCLPLAVAAQETEAGEDDEGFLVGLIEDNLSSADRVVNITGFDGALSSEATMTRLTIADADGVWLTVEDIVMTWSRSALLRGAVEIDRLRAGRLVLARPPKADPAAPVPEAVPFALPDLPVSLRLGALEVDRVELAEGLLGAGVTGRTVFSLSGEATLADGQGAARISAERLEGPAGRFAFDASFDNATGFLDLALTVDEAPAGLAASLLGLPGAPGLALALTGAGPLSDFAADLRLTSAGQDRLAGRFTLREADAGDRQIALALGGNPAPLFAPDYARFFGQQAALSARATQFADGRFSLTRLALDAAQITLAGTADFTADGWPSQIDLRGAIGADDGAAVLLPLPGAPSYLESAELLLSFDAALSDRWEGGLFATGIARPGLRIAEVELTGTGAITPDGAGGVAGFDALVDYAARGLGFDDPAAAEVFGDALSGQLSLSGDGYGGGGNLTVIDSLSLRGAGLSLAGKGSIAGAADGFRTSADLALDLAGLERFAPLLGQEIGGAASVTLAGQVTPLDGGFDLALRGQSQDLRLGIAPADQLLQGAGNLRLQARRDSSGLRITALRAQTDQLRISASAMLRSGGSVAEFDSALSDLGLLLPELAGPAGLAGQITRSAAGDLGYDLAARLPGGQAELQGSLRGLPSAPEVALNLRAELDDLARYAAVAGRDLAGAAELTLSYDGPLDGQRFTGAITAETLDLQLGDERFDPLLLGRGELQARFARTGAMEGRVEALLLRTPALRLAGDAALDSLQNPSADLELTVYDAVRLDPALSGPLVAAITATPGPAGLTFADLRLRAAETEISADLEIGSGSGARPISGTLEADIADLGRYARLIRQPVAGALAMSAEGQLTSDLRALDARLSLRSSDLAIGEPTVDALLAGQGRINADLSLSDGALALRTLEVSTGSLSVVAALNGAAGAGQGRFNASLRDLAVLSDQLSGAARASGAASLSADGLWGVDATATGPGGLGARIAGSLDPGGTLDLSITGSAPLALANQAIEPRRLSGQANFDLSVQGPPALASLSGEISFADGRLTAPTFGEALGDLTGAITLADNAAALELTGLFASGGQVTASGPVALSEGYQADLSLRVRNLILQDPELYRARINGGLTLRGPLAGGARIAGTFEVNETNLQVPSSAITSLGDLPVVRHQAAPTEVLATLARAGLTAEGRDSAAAGDQGQQSGPAYPLDLEIDAPSRIFIRGRGLDAELGGRLEIGGTTANVIPVGQFDLIRGRLDILGQRFALTEGSATLEGDFEPEIRLVANTQSPDGTQISIIIAGPASAPEVRFESVPALPQDEVLAQLIFGRDLQSISALQAVQLAAAVNTLAGRGGDTLAAIRSTIRLDDLDLTTDEEGTAALRAGAYLSKNIYTDVTVTTDGSTDINLNLDLTDEITARGGLDQEGDTSLGLFFQRDY